MYYILIGLLLLNSNITCDLKKIYSKSSKRDFFSAVFASSNASFYNIPLNNRNKTVGCKWLRGFKHQNQVCRKSKEFAETLQEAKELAVSNCRQQFMYDRWNCTYRKGISKKIYRETALLQAIAASALTHSIARACADGKLLICRCASVPKKKPQSKTWKWGGCGDNVKDAVKITKRFLQLRATYDDWQEEISNYNARLGIGVVAQNQYKKCHCHGVSASCVIKTCWKRLRPFEEISEKLRNSYHDAVKISPGNKANAVASILNGKQRTNLLYTTESPNFCSTQGRECKDENNCATLCCGRGPIAILKTIKKICNCTWEKCCFPSLKCDECVIQKSVNICR